LHAAVAAVRSEFALTRSPRNQAKWEKSVDAARAAIGATAFDAAWSDGSGWTLKAAVDRALTGTAALTVTA
jgi:hypothetical protein